MGNQLTWKKLMINSRLTRNVVLFITTVVITSLGISSSASAYKSKAVVNNIVYKNNKVTIFIDPANGQRPKFKYNSLPNKRFYVDVLNSKVSKPLNYKAGNGNVKRIVRNQFNSNTSRIVLHLASNKSKPSVKYYSNPPRLEVNFDKNVRKQPSKVFTVLIDPGHGGKQSPGAIGPKGTYEKDITLDIALKLGKILEGRDDLKVKYTRKSDVYVSLRSRKYLATKYKADLFISIHVNSHKNKKFENPEIYWRDSKSKKLANYVKNELKNLNRFSVVKKHWNFSPIKRNPAKLGSVLVESGYISNPKIEKKLNSDKYQSQIANSISQSIDKYLDNYNK